MGTQRVRTADGGEADREAMRRVLRDLDAMEQMLQEGWFETAPRRIGVEQELVLVDDAMQPAPIAEALIERIVDARVVPEIAKFNVEFNGDPLELGGSCLSSLERQLYELYAVVDDACREMGARALLTGICPTVDLNHLSTNNIMPSPRYRGLDDALRKLRGEDYELHIDGADELTVSHPSVMLESVNTSFQVHYQTAPDEFAAVFNIAMATAAPVLAAATNAPLLFGKRLWHETRIATFQQALDTRREGAGHRDLLGRVRFGEAWVESSVLEIVRSDVARFRQLVYAALEDTPDPMEEIRAGRVPKLVAWQSFNSTVYRWMRPCFGVGGGKPHLRIENRLFPSGPTIADEVANAAFWIGLLAQGPHDWPEVSKRLDFSTARGNFLRAARDGLAVRMGWLDGAEHAMDQLILDEFLPVARRGLERVGVDAADAERALLIIEKRVSNGQTGARWTLDAFGRIDRAGRRQRGLAGLTKTMLENQDTLRPVHEWPVAEQQEAVDPAGEFSIVSQCMTTDLFTVQEHECVDLVASIMDWEHVRHIPVEDAEHRLVGLISYRKLLRALVRGRRSDEDGAMPVSEIMVREPVTVSPDTPTLDAIKLMAEHRVACLPVVEEGRLVGVVSDRDYARLARRLLERAIQEGSES